MSLIVAVFLAVKFEIKKVWRGITKLVSQGTKTSWVTEIGITEFRLGEAYEPDENR